MRVSSVEFEHLDPAPFLGWVMRITIRGENFDERAIPMVAEVGEQAVEGLSCLFEEEGVQGFLATEPKIGDVVRIGYADSPLIDTDFTYRRAEA